MEPAGPVRVERRLAAILAADGGGRGGHAYRIAFGRRELGDRTIAEHRGRIVKTTGDGVNLAARLEGLADPGGICISGRVRADVAGKLGVGFEDLVDQQLKNISRPVRVFRVRPEGPLPNPRPQAGEGRVGALSLPHKPSLAVLPFQNMTGDPEQEYLATAWSRRSSPRSAAFAGSS
jgi:class 3 adenylate cyclase